MAMMKLVIACWSVTGLPVESANWKELASVPVSKRQKREAGWKDLLSIAFWSCVLVEGWRYSVFVVDELKAVVSEA